MACPLAVWHQSIRHRHLVPPERLSRLIESSPVPSSLMNPYSSTSLPFFLAGRRLRSTGRTAFCQATLAILTALAMSSLGSRAYAVGAATPFTTIEAESGTVSGGATVVTFSGTPGFVMSPELEASGRAYVALKAPDKRLLGRIIPGITLPRSTSAPRYRLRRIARPRPRRAARIPSRSIST